MVFNVAITEVFMDDKQLIENLGGARAVARLLGFDDRNGTQRVHNWISRGIPSKVKLDHADVFLMAAKLKKAA